MPDPISWSLSGPYYAAALLVGYLLGAIPFGLLFTRWAGLGDIRQVGSGNIGATNVLRTGKKGLALATLLADGAKGALAVFLGMRFGGPDLAVLAGLGGFLGHLFPIWLRFRGGKGVATFLGINLALHWPAGLAVCGTWLLIALLTRLSSLSALTAAALAPVYLAVTGHIQFAELAGLLAVLLWIAHRANIARLLKGAEPKIGAKK